MSKEPEKFNDSQEVNAPECSEELSDMTTAEAASDESTEQAEHAEEPALEETVSEATVSEESISEEDQSEEIGEAPAEESAEQETEDASAETEHAEAAPEKTVNHKILAIRSALKTQEEERQMEETKSHIADKVKKYKTYKETGELPPEDAPEQAEIPVEKKKAEKSGTPKKKKSKKAKKKKNSLFPKKGDSPLEVIRKCVFLASSAIFVGCLCLIADYFWDNHQNSLLADSMTEIYQEQEDDIPEETQPATEALEGYEYYGYLSGAERLLEINPDVTGWINIPGTDINYPVLQRRGQEDGNDYYLKRNIMLEDAHAGSIFLDYRNNFDYVEGGHKLEENSDNLIVYGHNMHDYSMFGSLKHYINNADYYSEHPIVELNSNYRKYQYKIFGFIVVDVDDMTETRFDYWNVLDFADEQAFYDYVNEVKRRTIRLTDVDVKYGDELLTLSTCNSTFSNGRLVVFARKLRDGEDLYADTETSTANPNIKWPNSYYKWRKNTYDPDAEFIPYG